MSALSMSQFLTAEDYWQARAEQAEQQRDELDVLCRELYLALDAVVTDNNHGVADPETTARCEAALTNYAKVRGHVCYTQKKQKN